jgi:hypothetical protein
MIGYNSPIDKRTGYFLYTFQHNSQKRGIQSQGFIPLRVALSLSLRSGYKCSVYVLYDMDMIGLVKNNQSSGLIKAVLL